jgi:hypothetical protein
LVLLTWVTMIGSFVETFPAERGGAGFLTNGSFIVLGAIATVLVMHRRFPVEERAAYIPADDKSWGIGKPYALLCAVVPLLVVLVSALSMAMQNGPVDGARLRFGPNAYWREQSAMIGTWNAAGFTPDTQGDAPVQKDNLDIQSIVFTPSRNVVLRMRDGSEIAQRHRWHYMNSMTHLDWNELSPDVGERASVDITLRDGRMYIPWPPNRPSGTYLMLEQ